ncbi:uncharacterized protein LOC127510627 isoform X3 [Ctenopharyngodon idella]|uniref:uncharacterized protein LOC127510627 isoform X3 n=1 Tax=Ctenopharyngodon idella TaxID=7959 RepID=UPI002232CA67|nr:uncharacterized protein LOC127510627 isoform X3 [Ctenopharyngodon idella]
MKILLNFFTFYLISGAVKHIDVSGYSAVKHIDVFGYSGRSLLVRSWKTWHYDDAKYMQKLQNTTIITRMKHDQWINEGRFTLFRNDYGDLIIYIRDVITEDAGTYRIEVEGESSIKMTLTVKEDSCCRVSKRVKMNMGENATFSCEYSQNLNNEYMLFKEGKDSIETIYNTWMKKERFNISDDTQKNIFSVRISAVTPDDGGVYLCGVSVGRSSYSFSIINTVHLHIINKVGVSRLSGYSGGRMMIKCEHPRYKTKPKYICKESDGCSERKNPGVQDEWMENGDVSLYDDTRAGVLIVFFRELKAADAGTYRCGVNVSHYTESFTELQLNITDDAKYPRIVTESAHLGEEVNNNCQIPEEHKVHFCKEDDNHICLSTEMSGSSERNEERVFTVSISNVSVRDAGVHWCGAETRDTHLTSTSEIQLINNSSMIIIICVCVILLLIGVFILTVCKLRHKRQGDARTQSSVRSTPQSPTVPSGELLYASVSFRKHEKPLSDATVSFSKDQINSEYATVSHRMRLD